VLTDLFESSGGWVALLIVGIVAIFAVIAAIVLRLRGNLTERTGERPMGPSTAPGAPRTAPAADAAPNATRTVDTPKSEPANPASSPVPPQRPEGVGSAWQPPTQRRVVPPADTRKFDRRPSPAPAPAQDNDGELPVGAKPAPPPPAPGPTVNAPAARRPEGIGAASAPARDPRAAETSQYRNLSKTVQVDDSPASAPRREPPPPPPSILPGAPAPMAAARRAIGEDQGDYVAVTVHYGTDRRDTGEKAGDPAARFSYERAQGAPGSLISYGTCTVSIPKTHVAGGLEDRTWVQWTTGQARQPGQHVMVVSLSVQQPELFFSTLSEAVARSSKKDAFVFVHGFSVTFADAARRTAQMAYDLRFEGAPIFFSWPTPDFLSAPLTAYTTSEGNAILSATRLKTFLQDVLEKTGAETMHVIAHSMGNRLVTDALQDVDAMAQLKPRIGEVILTAPDIDTTLFNEVIAPRLTKFTPRVTLYASTKDRAIGSSEGAHNNPRIGDFQSLLTTPQGVEVIDASGVESSTLGHSYYGDNEAVIADLCYLLNLGERAGQRSLTLRTATTPGGSPCWSVMTRSLSEVYTLIAARRAA